MKERDKAIMLLQQILHQAQRNLQAARSQKKKSQAMLQ